MGYPKGTKYYIYVSGMWAIPKSLNIISTYLECGLSQSENIRKPTNSKVFGSNKAKGLKHDRQNWLNN